MSAPFSIGKRRIGGDAPCFIVAELSANHGGKLETALRTVEAAAKAGADAIKLQTYTPDTLTLKSDAAPFVVKTKNEWAGRTLHDLYAEAMTPWEWHKPLMEAAASHGLLCFSTPFDATATEYLEQLDVPAYKIASFELVDLPLIEHVARAGKPMIMSTGMATLEEIQAAVAVCRSAGNNQIVLLRCVSNYPAKPESMHLKSIEVLKTLGTVVGLSDHTRDATVALCSVALGAKMVEKHFIVDRAVGGPDAFFSLEPAEFRAMVDSIRAAESALQGPRFGPSAEEQGSLAFRRSLFVARDVTAGAVLTCDDVRSVRPSNGISPRHLPEVLGRPAARALKAGDPFAWDMVAPNAGGPTVELRPATQDDSADLLRWRNDPATREASVQQGEVSLADHVAWLEKALVSKDRLLFVGWRENQRLGQVRLDSRGQGAWEVSITVAPEQRGRGLAAAMLRAGEAAAKKVGATLLTARIRQANTASLKAFKRAGYYSFIERACATGPVLQCERRIAPY